MKTRVDGIKINQKLEVGLQHNMSLISNNQLDVLYDSFAEAETGHLPDPYVRTSASKAEGGSDAFGPVQIMSKLYGKNAPRFADTGNIMIDYTEDEAKLQSKLINQTDLYYMYGNEPNKPGYDIRFDYSDKGEGSGLGFGLSDEEKESYESSAKKLIEWQFNYLAKGDPHKMMNIWRYGDARGERHEDSEGNIEYKDISVADPRYYEVMTKELGDTFKQKSVTSSIIDSLKRVK